MEHTYQVTGMTCENCVQTIKKILLKIPNVSSININLAINTATIQMTQHISIEQFNHALHNTKYQLSNEKMVTATIENSSPTRLKDFLPLISAFGIILLYTIAMLIYHGSWNSVYAMRHFEGAFFIIFGALKLLNWKGFVDAYRTYDIVAKRSQIYAYGYPLIELALGIAYLMAFQLFITNMITLVIMMIGTIGVTKALIDKKQIICACMGVVFKVPMTTVTLVEDLLMGCMALLMIVLM